MLQPLLRWRHTLGIAPPLWGDGTRLLYRPAFMVTAPEANRMRDCKPELIFLLRSPDRLKRCPACRWPLDSKQRCPKCFDRLCVDCGRLTGSYFIMRCVVCGHSFREEPA